MSEPDWKLIAVGRGIDLAILEEALREIDSFRPSEAGGDPYMQIAGFAMRRTREALALLAESRNQAA